MGVHFNPALWGGKVAVSVVYGRIIIQSRKVGSDLIKESNS